MGSVMRLIGLVFLCYIGFIVISAVLSVLIKIAFVVLLASCALYLLRQATRSPQQDAWYKKHR